MFDDVRHGGDLQLVERCLEGLEDALYDLQNTHEPMLSAFLLAAGASDAEARDILASLWTDCVIGQRSRKARFLNYRGQCRLIAWLKTVVMNELIDRRRRTKRQEPLETALHDVGAESGAAAIVNLNTVIQPATTDSTLLEIMRNALTEALKKCPAQVLVMLQLVYINELTQREVAQMWGWTDSKISRALAAGMQTISEETLRLVRRADPWLELRWDDFIELCSGTDWAFLT